MKLMEAIAAIDRLKSNSYDLKEKVQWLSALDAMVKQRIIDTHEGGEAVRWTSYTEQTPGDTQLLLPEPYDQLYLWWVSAQMDFLNGEITRYNNAIELFNSGYAAYADAYHRSHKPLTGQSDFL